MSYDLFLARRRGSELPLEEFQAYFAGRPRWSVKDKQAWYGNEDTGVYFSFDFGSEEVEAGDEVDAAGGEAKFETVVAFNINYFRPHFFGLEAAPELAAFVFEFDLVVDDPQMGGMGRGEFSVDGFLAGWNTGNRLGYEAIVSQRPTEVFPALPTADLERHWIWNNARQRLQEDVGEVAFVPRVMFHAFNGKICSGLVWGDAIPSLLPVVDTLLIPRQEHAPRRFLRRVQDLVCISWEQALPLIGAYPVADMPVRHFRVLYSQAPENLVSFVREQAPYKLKLEGFSTDKVLNAELVESARNSDILR